MTVSTNKKKKIQDNIHLRLGSLSRPLERFRKTHGFEHVQDAIRDIVRDRLRQDAAERKSKSASDG